MEVNWNKLDKDIPDLFELDNKNYSFNEILYFEGLTGDKDEEDKWNGK